MLTPYGRARFRGDVELFNFAWSRALARIERFAPVRTTLAAGVPRRAGPGGYLN
jgi:hypothetical protein